jgi:hypothetical protein
MEKLTLILFLAIGIIQAQNKFGEDYIFASDNFIEVDKQYHFVFGGLSSTVGYFMGWELSKENRRTAIWTGIGMGTSVNVLKEITDINKTGFSMEDVAFGALGAVVGTLVTDLIFQSEGSRKRRAQLKLDAKKARIDSFYE